MKSEKAGLKLSVNYIKCLRLEEFLLPISLAFSTLPPPHCLVFFNLKVWPKMTTSSTIDVFIFSLWNRAVKAGVGDLPTCFVTGNQEESSSPTLDFEVRQNPFFQSAQQFRPRQADLQSTPAVPNSECQSLWKSITKLSLGMEFGQWSEIYILR